VQKLALSLFFFLLFSSHLSASTSEFTQDFLNNEEILALLGPYPEDGSFEAQEDLRILQEYQNTRTQEECRIAASQDRVTLANLFVLNGGPLTRQEARRLSVRLLPLYAEAGINIHRAKTLFKRPRPYDTHSSLTPCIPKESSFAYPSGHTALARALARVLSERFPERAEQFMQRADSVSRNRIIGGVHYPSDVVAGKKLGDEIANFMIRQGILD
jgi:acid phosphatase (class A)